MTILVTGASGHLSRLIVERLLARGVDLGSITAGACTVATVARAADLGVRVVPLDYADPATVSAALEGLDTLVLVSGSEVGRRVTQHRTVVEAAERGVSKLVYTSVPKANTSALMLAPEHKATEEMIATSGLPAVILRKNWYTENYADDLAQAGETGEIVARAGDGRVASVSRRDFAEAAAVVALEDGHLDTVYELGGDVAWDYDNLAAAIGTIDGREVTYRRVSPYEQVAALREAGLDENTAGFVAALDAGIRDGALAETDGTLSRLIGRPTTSLVEGLRAAV